MEEVRLRFSDLQRMVHEEIDGLRQKLAAELAQWSVSRGADIQVVAWDGLFFTPADPSDPLTVSNVTGIPSEIPWPLGMGLLCLPIPKQTDDSSFTLVPQWAQSWGDILTVTGTLVPKAHSLMGYGVWIPQLHLVALPEATPEEE